MTAVLDRT
jgi:hypothetical protein